jgi:Response regulator containing CheY-like receiver domain and AraC-type DNA-binding domain
MSALREYRVLFVDDEKLSRDSIRELVDWNANGFALEGCAANGVEALKLMESSRPDIVLTDIRMPEMDGLELIERASAMYPDMAFAVLSGYGDFELTSRAMRFGIKHYILKPCNENDVIAVLRELAQELERERGEREHLAALEEQLRLLEASSSAPEADSASREIWASRPQDEIVASIRVWAEKHYADRDLSLSWIGARLLYMNPEYIGRIFHRETGERFSDFLMRLRMEKAKRLIVERGDLRLYQIAQLVGYSDDGQYFCKSFKKYTGFSPSEFCEALCGSRPPSP